MTDNDSHSLTRLDNPGIIVRLAEDTPGFAPFGFSFEQESKSSAVFSAPVVFPSPACFLSIRVPKRAFIGAVGTFLRTLVRLATCTPPQALRVRLELHEVEASSVVHDVHVIVRNSMGAALFLALQVVVPHGVLTEEVRGRFKSTYPSIATTSTAPTGNSNECENKNDLVWHGAPDNSFRVHLAPGLFGPLVPSSVLHGFDPARHCLLFDVDCLTYTVNATPVLFRLTDMLKRDMLKRKQHPPSPLGLQLSHLQQEQPQAQHQPHCFSCVVVCVSKLPNLHRILAVFGDYGVLHRLAVVVPNVKTLQRFRATLKKSAEDFPQEKGNDLHSACLNVPVMNEQDAATLLANKRLQGMKVYPFDLDPKAMVLNPPQSKIMEMPCASDTKFEEKTHAGQSVVVFGYEREGIPPSLVENEDCCLQINSRSSLNLVVSICIMFHCMLENSVNITSV